MRGMTEDRADKGFLMNILLTIILFFYIYEFNFDTYGMPSFITSRRIALILLIVLYVIKSIVFNSGRLRFESVGGKSKSVVQKQIWMQLCMLVYATFITLAIGRGTGFNISDDIIKLLLFGILPVFLFYQVYDSVDDFLSALLIVTVIQAIIIVLCLVNAPFRSFIDTTYESEYVIIHRNGYAGGLACITAPGFFRFSMGLIACLYFTITRKKTVYLVLFIVLGFIGTMVARTGLFVSLLGLLLVFIALFKDKDAKPILRSILVLFFVVIVVLLAIKVFNLVPWLESTFTRLIMLSERGINNGFMQGYFHGSDNTYVKISMKTFFGIGVTSGISGNGVVVNVDGGFFRLIAAIGVIMALIFYIVLFAGIIKTTVRIRDKSLIVTLTYFLFILLMGEFKEYTVYAQYMVCFIYLLFALIEKEGLFKD